MYLPNLFYIAVAFAPSSTISSPCSSQHKQSPRLGLVRVTTGVISIERNLRSHVSTAYDLTTYIQESLYIADPGHVQERAGLSIVVGRAETVLA